MVSVIILAYNRCSELLITLRRLKQLSASFPFAIEIIVVDNASVDDTSNQVNANYPEVTLITCSHNSGIAGWNEGFKIAKYDYLLVLDDDSCVESGFEEAVKYINQHKDVGILALNIVNQQLSGDPLLNPDEAWKHLHQVEGFIGCGAIIRRSVYQKIGGFADWLFIYTHEFDYSLRALHAGFKTVFFEKCNVIHRASLLNRTNKRLRVFGTRNEMAIIYAHFESEKWKYLGRTLINNLKFIKREGFSSGWYVLQGALKFYQMRKSLPRTPVSADVQKFYSSHFWSAKPVFKNRSITAH